MKKMALWGLFLAMTVVIPGTARAQSAAEKAVLSVVQNLFDAMRTKDVELIKATMIPDAFMIAVGDGRMSQSTRDDFASSIAGLEVDLIERIWDPEVRIDGLVAQVWAPYDLYRGNEFSHCGVDAFHLVHVGGEWKMAGVTYSRAQPPTCKKHPEGPPK